MKKVIKVFLGINIVAIYIVLLVVLAVVGYKTLTEDQHYYVQGTEMENSVSQEHDTQIEDVITEELDATEDKEGVADNTIENVTEDKDGLENSTTETIIDESDSESWEVVMEIVEKPEPELFSISQQDAQKIAAEAYNCKLDNMVFYQNMIIEGEKYYTFLYTDDGGGASDELIIVDKKKQSVYAYDVFGNMKVVEPLLFEEDILDDSYLQTLNIVKDDTYIQLYDSGKYAMKYIDSTMNFDEVIAQTLKNNNMVVDAPGAYSGEYPTAQSGDPGEGDDTTGVMRQIMYDMKCQIRYNFDHTLGSDFPSATTRVPELEEIVVYFYHNNSNLDRTFLVKEKVAAILGEPHIIYQLSDIRIFHWTSKLGDGLNITYRSDEDGYYLFSMRLDSLKHKQKNAEFLKKFFSRSED